MCIFQVEQDLAAAKPALLEAEEALKAITPKDIQGLKALKNPPVVIRVVFDGVMILKMRNGLLKCQPVEEKGTIVYKDSYPEAMKMMGESTFLQSLLEFKKEVGSLGFLGFAANATCATGDHRRTGRTASALHPE